jgi:hypothetical protein
MNDNILRLILPALKAEKPSSQTGKNDDAALILPLALLLMYDTNDLFLVLSLMYIIL